MGDLAVRLGSIVEYDRRGDIVALDDFEDTILKWSLLSSPGGSAVLDSTVAKSGSQSVKIISGNVIGRLSNIHKSFIFQGAPQIGIEVSLCDPSNGADFYFHISHWDGVNGQRAQVWYDRSVGLLYAEYPVIGAWTPIANIGILRRNEHLFYPIKLVVDFSTGFYKRLLFSDTEHDLSTIAIPPIGLAGADYLSAQIMCVSAIAAEQTLWVDNFILTQNEP